MTDQDVDLLMAHFRRVRRARVVKDCLWVAGFLTWPVLLFWLLTWLGNRPL